MTSPLPDISVVTPSHNRRDSVLRLLDRLRDGTFPAERFEVIVVADGCQDDTIPVLAAARYPFQLQVLEQTPGRGAANARNRGAAVARGAVLIFIDDDIEPLPTLLATHAEAHAAAGPDPLVVVGAPIPVRTRESDFQHLAVWGWWEQQFEQMSRAGHRFTYEEVFSGILSMPAALFSAVGGFEVALNSCRDDSELGLRLIRGGARVVFSRAAGGYHHEMRDRARLIGRKRAEGRADVLLARKYPELWCTLRLSQGTGRSLALRILHRTARTHPWLGDILAGTLARSLVPLERMRLRGTWRQVHAGVMYYAYWRGAMEAFANQGNGTRALAETARRAADLPSQPHKEIDIDLAAGIEVAERELDRQRPDAAVVRLGVHEIGRIPPRTGAEPLRGIHLRHQLAHASLGWPLLHTIALQEQAARPLQLPDGGTASPLEHLCLVAGALLAQGRSPGALTERVAVERLPEDRGRCADAIFRSAVEASVVQGERPAECWQRIAPDLDAFLQALETRSTQRGLARSLRLALERRVATLPLLTRPLSLGLTHLLAVETTDPIVDVALDWTVERAHILLTLEREPLGTLELPVCDGILCASVLRDAIADRYGWRILGRFFEQSAYRDVQLTEGPEGWIPLRDGVRIASAPQDNRLAALTALHDRIGWQTLLDLLWPAHGSETPAETGAPAIDAAIAAPELAWCSVEAGEPLVDQVVAAPVVVVELRIGGVPLDAFEVETEHGLLPAARVRARLITGAGFELVRMVVREALLGSCLEGTRGLAERLRSVASRSRMAASDALPPEDISPSPGWGVAAGGALPAGRAGMLIARRIDLPGHTASARVAMLPASVTEDAGAAESLHRTPMVPLRGVGAPLLGYVPSLLWRRRGLVSDATGRAGRLGDDEEVETRRLPILMYHRVAGTGVPTRDRYRVTPEDFESQLCHLHASGYRTVTFEEWRMATLARKPLPGRAVLLTFDDGYRDFATSAWPLLRRYGFGAMVFLVAGSIGRCNTWDPVDGEQEPLLEWDDVRQLGEEGVVFGAHSVTHRPLTLLSPDEIAREALRSRSMIESETGRPVTAFAYPYGDEDPGIRHLIGGCGFTFGLTCRYEAAALDGDLLGLPRLEVRGTDDLATFAARLAVR